MVFKDVYVSIGKTDILNNVYGMAKVGQMLAIMGPSGMLITSLIFKLDHFTVAITFNHKL